MRAKKRMLIVEDDEAFSAVLVDGFEAEDFIVDTARCSDEAYAMLDTGSFSIIVLDWNLINSHRGEATSKGVLKKCKRLYPHVPVVVISGFNTIDVRNDAIQNGADSFLGKPFGVELLISHAKQWIERVAAVDEHLWPIDIAGVLPLNEVQRKYVLRVLKLTGENVSRAAEALKIHRHTVASIKAAK